ncbi:MAG TPA: TonB family protein [Rhodocyclaceae bacterium]|nr:TonB family protein [Rhodocyclaceae bacterium]
MKNEVNLDNAGLGRALLVSLALHALVLWQVLVNVDGWQAQSPQASEGNVMNARLHGSAVSQPAVSTPLLPVSVQAGSPHPVKRSRMNVPHDVRPPAGNIVPPPPLALASAANTLTVATTSMVSDGIDGEGLRRYRVGLAAAARQFRSYPAQAKGWQGSVEIRLTIAADGSALPLQLLHGSGAELLDTAALDMISGAARSTDLPGVLRGKTFSMDMLLEFLPEEDSVR